MPDSALRSGPPGIRPSLDADAVAVTTEPSPEPTNLILVEARLGNEAGLEFDRQNVLKVLAE
jgi:hypothetical protein